jgi:maleylacetoacetate isomerase/maleylpyruvate isomerase
MKFFSFWRSLASFRVRIALNLKNVPAEVIFVDLDANAHRDPEYRKINPQMALPALVEDDGTTLFQSLAILEYLDEKYPDPPLLPVELRVRAHARALAQMVAMDAHPFIVPRVRKYLEDELHVDDAARAKWVRHWLDAGSHAIEAVLARDPRTGKFCVGDQVTVADICLAAHLTSAKLFGGRDPSDYPTAGRIYANCMAIDAFAAEHPLRQPDAPKS